MSKPTKTPVKPLPLADVLRDLAVLRSSSKDIPTLFKLPNETPVDTAAGNDNAVDAAVKSSYDFVQASRAAIRLHDSGKLDAQGTRIEQVRNQYEDMLDGLHEDNT
ncbi:hypothetical protein D9619_001385 [Psilocybe cf. subviscida]|uniref:Uncharacterized protein n=1 Tax=Psilocybe cf. subviscida TaxID=2480587 RepID=A0A8H5F3Z8_9AGAR|nr:hypothetical protein D9619_001385 [Psilocybe cf. subviscida]